MKMKWLSWLFIVFLVLASTPVGVVGAEGSGDHTWETRVVPSYMVVQGLAIAGIWATSFIDGTFEEGFFQAREDDLLFWPHVVAEVLTAGGLVIGGYGLYTGKSWGKPASLIALGALGYTSINSLNWALAKRDRYPMAIPMVIGVAGSALSIWILF